MGIKPQGKMNFKAEKGDKFVKIHNNKLVDSGDNYVPEMLTNEEIVIYGYMALDSYVKEDSRKLCKKTDWELSVNLTIDVRTIKDKIQSLEIKGMVKKLKSGVYEILGERLKGDYVMVTRSFLISRLLTTAQKAFLLRLDALRREGLMTGDKISQSKVAALLFMGTPAISKLLSKMVSKNEGLEIAWAYREDNDIVVDYEALRAIVENELVEEIVEYRNKEYIRLHNTSQNIRYGIIKTTKKTKELLDRLDVLVDNKTITEERAKYIFTHYIKKGLLKRAKEMITRYENK